MSTTAPPVPPSPSAGPARPLPASEAADRETIARPPKSRPQNFGLNTRRLRIVRLICFAVLAVPLALLALLAAKFVSMPLTQAWHDGAYDEKDYPTAIERLAPVEVVNWFEPYLPHLTRGTDLLQQGKNAEAEKELRTSLEKWEKGKDLNQPQHAQCKILNNLAISIERQADGITDPAARADRLYEAEEILAPCASGGGGGEGDGGQGQGKDKGGQGGGEGNEDGPTTKENGERVKEKRRKADEEAGKDPGDRPTEKQDGKEPGGEEPGDGEPIPPGKPKKNDPKGTQPPEEAPTSGGEEGKKKEDELDKRNKDAQGGEGEDSGGSSKGSDKPW